MKKTALILALLTLQACTGDSSLPDPTGKGTIRSINAIEGSPNIAFLIEERQLEAIAYKSASSAQRFDDFEYNFNFEVQVLGESNRRRVATVTQKIDANRDYTFVMTGALLSPTITVWETDESQFDESATTFEVRFSHVAASLGSVDVYFDTTGTAPVLGNARGRLSLGETLDPILLEAGEYVLTFTAPDDPTTLVYQTNPVTFAERSSQIIPIFDGDELDPSTYNVRLINSAAGVANLPDALTQPTVRLIQASISLAPSDVYDDEMLTNQVLSNHQFGDVENEFSVPIGVTTYTYTAVGNPGAVQFESGIETFAGTRSNFVVIGDMDNRVATTYVPDRRSIDTLVRMSLYHAALNFENLDLYIVEAGTSIDDVSRTLGLVYSLITPSLSFVEGSYDIYVTVADEKTVVGGPFTVDTTVGDTLELMLFDTADPNVAEIRLIPAP